MKRRDFLRVAGVSPLATLLPKPKTDTAQTDTAQPLPAVDTTFVHGDSTWADAHVSTWRVSVNGVPYNVSLIL